MYIGLSFLLNCLIITPTTYCKTTIINKFPRNPIILNKNIDDIPFDINFLGAYTKIYP